MKPEPPQSVDEYLERLAPERREVLSQMREAINAHLPSGYEEGIQYGMIGWFVPHSVYPPGYHCDPKQPLPFVSIASQKHHVSFNPFCIYTDEALKEWFVAEYQKTGYKLDMGKACIRFKKMDQIPYGLIGQVVAKVPVDAFIAAYENAIPASRR